MLGLLYINSSLLPIFYSNQLFLMFQNQLFRLVRLTATFVGPEGGLKGFTLVNVCFLTLCFQPSKSSYNVEASFIECLPSTCRKTTTTTADANRGHRTTTFTRLIDMDQYSNTQSNNAPSNTQILKSVMQFTCSY